MGKKVWAGVILVAAIAIVCISAAVLLQNEDNDINTEPVLAELIYEFHEDDITAKVKGISNKDSATTLIIPETVLHSDKKYRVTSIADDAFSACDRLTGDIVIPDSVESIGKSAFRECTGFDGKLTLGSGLRTIEEGAFYGCNRLAGDIVIPDSVESIDKSAFYGCTMFDGKLILGNGLQVIEDRAFYGCRLRGSLIIPDSVEIIGSDAFSLCLFSGDLKLGNGLESVYGQILKRFEGNLIFDCGNLRSDQQFLFDRCHFDSLTILKNGFILGHMDESTVKEINIALDVTDTGELTKGWQFYDRTRLLPPEALPGYTYVLDGDKMVRHGEFN